MMMSTARLSPRLAALASRRLKPPACRAATLQHREMSVLRDLMACVRSWFKRDAALTVAKPPAPASVRRVVLSTQRTGTKTCYLVDGNNLLYMVYDPTCSLTYNTMHVGATVRFLQRIRDMILVQRPDRLLVCFDTRQVTKRKKENPSYKADRASMQPQLRPQFKLTTDALQVLNLPIACVPGVEADDLIASYSKACVADGYDVVIVSNDNDFLQLVDSTTVTVLKPSRNRLMRERDVRAMLHGGKPFLQPDIRALCGDRWGKTPGLPGGLSRREAVDLLEEHGGLLQLLNNLDKVEDETMHRRLTESAEMLRMSYRMTKLDDHLDLPIPLDDLVNHGAFNSDVLDPIIGTPAAAVVKAAL
ncbi:hypothetical protein ACHHYP_05180 [Achlya hypogyna]|uniref:5'-3' exonuclease domain-containing protein n=1 Tax=Achlya hypogyna TaxID=1202772 RepID=A0A1V9YYQ8_ACHHY|nr:hypothetical protein ACHHYP_05180 [Achlya hypogyna]